MLQLLPVLTKLFGMQGGAAKGVGELLTGGGKEAVNAAGALMKMGDLTPDMVGGGATGGGAGGAPPTGGLLPGTGVQGAQIPGAGVISPEGGLMPELRGLSAPVEGKSPLLPPAPTPSATGGVPERLMGPLDPTYYPETMELLPDVGLKKGEAFGRSGKKRTGLLGKYINTMGKVSDALYATPLIKEGLSSSRGSLQEKSLPVDLEIAGQENRRKLWEEIQENLRAEQQATSRIQAGKIQAEAAKEVGKGRIDAMDRATGQRAMSASEKIGVGLLEDYDLMSDEQQKFVNEYLRSKNLPQIPEVEKTGNWVAEFIKNRSEDIQEIKRAWSKARGVKGNKKVKEDPLGLF